MGDKKRFKEEPCMCTSIIYDISCIDSDQHQTKARRARRHRERGGLVGYLCVWLGCPEVARFVLVRY